jgi:glycosyltransferase involved in cell wall biosynthesis
MPSSPKISVIIPTHNRAALLERAIDSVLSQTFEDFELIVVDDGSSDNTVEVLSAIQSDRLIVIQHKQNQGQSAAANAGIERARGEIVSFLDSDDVWLRRYLEKVVEAFDKNPRAGFVYARLFNGEAWSLSGDRCYADVLSQGYLSATITLSARKSALDGVGRFNPKYSVCNDDDLCIRLARAYPFVLIPEELAVAHRTPGSMMQSREQVARGWRMILEDHGAEIVKHCGYNVYAYHCFRIANLAIGCGDFRHAFHYVHVGIGALFRSPSPMKALSKRDLVRMPWRFAKSFAGWFRRSRRKMRALEAAKSH